MCRNKSEGGRCAAALRQQMAVAHRKAEEAEAGYTAAQSAYEQDPSEATWTARRDADVARSAARREVRKLREEYDSTPSGQRELAAQIEAADDPYEKNDLQARAHLGRVRRSYYKQAEASGREPDTERELVSVGAAPAGASTGDDRGLAVHTALRGHFRGVDAEHRKDTRTPSQQYAQDKDKPPGELNPNHPVRIAAFGASEVDRQAALATADDNPYEDENGKPKCLDCGEVIDGYATAEGAPDYCDMCEGDHEDD